MIDFGFPDSKKIVGEITWATVFNPHHWGFRGSAIRVQGQYWNVTTGRLISGIVDTEATRWTMPSSFVDFYYSFVPGAAYERNLKVWFFLCTVKLPDIVITIEGKDITVPGSNINAGSIGSGICSGDLEAVENEDEMAIFGPPFMKHLYIIFGAAEGYMPKLGFAQSHWP